VITPVWIGAGVASGAVFVGLWGLLARPRPVRFDAPPPAWERWIGRLLIRWQAGWSPATRRALDVLGWSLADVRRRVLWIAGGSTLMAWAVLAALHLPVGWALGAAGLLGVGVAWGVVPWWVQRQAQDYRRAVMANYPLLLSMLRFYLGLDRSVPEALSAIVPLLGPRGRREVRRILADIRDGTTEAPAAFAASRARVDRMQWGILMDALAQNWGRRFTGTALEPLTMLLEGQREQAALRLTARLDMVTTIVPILAIFGTMVGALFVVGVSLFTGSGLSL
jgi:hypothetical protein